MCEESNEELVGNVCLKWWFWWWDGPCWQAKSSAGEKECQLNCFYLNHQDVGLSSWGVAGECSAFFINNLVSWLLIKEKHHYIDSELIRNTYFFFPSSLIRINHLILHNLNNLHRIPLSQPPLTRLSHNQYPSLSTFHNHSRVHSHPIRSSCLCLTFPNLPQVSIPPCITWDYFRCTITTKFSFLTLHGLFTGPLFTLHRVTLLILQMFHFLWDLAAAPPQITRAV